MNKNKILIGFIFVIAGLLVGVVFVTATTYFQLAVAILLYPLLALFFFVAFPRGVRVIRPAGQTTAVWPPASSAEKTRAKGDSIGIVDLDKRAFLKLIGGAGIALFLFSIFNKRVENLFFKSLPAPAPAGTISNGNGDLAQHQPMDGYSISEIDDNIIAFYGFTNKDGAWFIMREDTDTGSFRYIRGNSNFPGNWTNRANLKYDYYSSVFKP